MNASLIINTTLFIAFLLDISLAALIILNSFQKIPNFIFALSTLSVGLWTFGILMFNVTNDISLALFWNREFIFTSGLIASTFLHFALVLTGSQLNGRKIFLLHLPNLFVLIAIFIPNMLIKEIVVRSWGKESLLGNYYFLFGIYFSIYIIYALYKIFVSMRTAKGLAINQLKYIFAATFLTSIVGSYFNLYLILLGNYKYIWVGPYNSLILVFIISYAIFRHHLLDIEIVIKKTAFYSILTAILTAIFVSLILLGQYFFSGLVGHSSIWASIAGAFIIALIFQPLRDGIQNLVDRIFFRARYNYQVIINKYSHALTRPMADLDRFAKLSPYLLWKSMKLNSAAFIVLDRSNKQYVIRAWVGKGEELVGKTIPVDSPLIQELLSEYKELNREEINQIVRAKTGPERTRLEMSLRAMDELKADLIIPSISESEYFNQPTLLAALVLGRKMSDESFSKEDIGFLETLANQTVISIEYAFIFEELRKNQEQIVKNEKLAALGTTTAGIAHELKNPLTYLLTVAQSMAASWDNPAFKESVINLLPSEVERMKLIIDGLSDYSKTQKLEPEPADLTTIIDKVVAILGYEAKKNNVAIIKKYPPEGAIALADKNRLVQAFMNIIANGIQAMENKGGSLTISAQTEEKLVKIYISDTGPGITPEAVQRIFDPFFTTKETGTGLGLPITKKIIEEHHGSLQVASRPGQGTTFTVCLPRP